VTYTLTPLNGAAYPFAIDRDHPAMVKTGAVLTEIYGTEPMFVRVGASVPVTGIFQRTLAADTVELGFSQPGSGAHAGRSSDEGHPAVGDQLLPGDRSDEHGAGHGDRPHPPLCLRPASRQRRCSRRRRRRLRPVGLRPRYYSDDGEDALIMTTEPIREARYRERIEGLRTALDASPPPTRPEERAAADATGRQPSPEPPAQEPAS